ncbi:alpha/beta fold hydrolase [Paraburkholderia sp. GAS199]|uniref:alpha/beta fold hydrolase n=1 Tax=Paraburkholderia sp. GAS199 TaxID=3035126 RepID=UPI003D263133
MNYLTLKDGTDLFYKDWGQGRPLVFSHGWPLNADVWDAQMLYLLHKGYRVIAYDRRGHGRSAQPFDGHTMNTYADDLATLLDTLDIEDAALIGHSTGTCDIARMIGRHGTRRVSRVILIGAMPAQLLQTATNPGGLPIERFDTLRHQIATNRAQFFRDLARPYFGFNRPGSHLRQGVVEWFSSMGMTGSVHAEYESIQAFSETDFTDDLKRFDVPTMFIHGNDDQMVPIVHGAIPTTKLVRNSITRIYPGGPHGLCTTMPDQVNADIYAFLAD